MQGLAEDLGLTLGDRFLTSTRDVLIGHVVCSVYGAAFELATEGIGNVGARGQPDGPWLAATAEAGRVLVLFSSTDSVEVEPDLRVLLGRGRAFVGWAEAIVVNPDADGRYRMLGLRNPPQHVSGQSSVMLDSNVLIHMEKAAKGRESRDPRRDEAIQTAVLKMIHADVIPWLAIRELAQGRGQAWDDARAHSLRATMDAWFDGGAARAASLHDVRAAYKSAMKGPMLGGGENQRELPLQQAIYASLLQVGAQWLERHSGFRANERVGALEHFGAWMTDELGVILVPVFKVAFDRFVGAPRRGGDQYVDKLLKLGRDRVGDIWGAAWDITHLAFLDQTVDPSLLETEGRDAALLTADQALVSLREQTRVSAVLSAGHLSMTLMQFDVMIDRRLGDQRSRIMAEAARLVEVSRSRPVAVPTSAELTRLIERGEARLRSA
jgi:hypothetical protein